MVLRGRGVSISGGAGLPAKAGLGLFGILIAAGISLPRPPARNRIAQPINGAEISAVRGNVRPWVRPENDRGRVGGSFNLSHITIIFKPSDTQQSGLAALLRDLQNPSSPQYHRWLTPEQFGNEFGLSQNDVSLVLSWLENQGFTVDDVARSRMWVVFSGNADQVESTFHTQIHHYQVRGESYYANASDPTVPSAIAGVVLGFRGLDNFRPRPRALIRRVMPPKPRFTSSISGDHFLAPNDFATIYNVKGLYNSGITGAGQSIAIMGQTNIYTEDITAFRSASGLPASSPTVIDVPGSVNPGVSQDDLAEADLDLEWAGGIAPNATLIYINSSNVFDSFQYAIDQGVAPVISMTYGNCEANFDPASQLALQQETDQANAEGMTIVAASGDNGAADCEGAVTASQTVTVATDGVAVDLPASLPEVTGVGGTEFNEGSGNYWSSSNSSGNGSALSYIPETAWNDTSALDTLSASGGGASSIFKKPAWQTGPGVPNDNARDVPDIALSASPNHDPYLICSDGSCVNGFRDSRQNLNVVGGTSTGAPVFAALVALINQQTNSAAGQGNINYILYPLAAQHPDAFHDITTGNNKVPCRKGSKGCPKGGTIGYSAGTGYDLVTGLGSIDATNLVTDWASTVSAAPQQPSFRLSISPASLTIGSGSPASATLRVSALNGFTGSVSLACTVASSLTGATCSISPASVSTSGTATVTVTAGTQSAITPALLAGTASRLGIAGALLLLFVSFLGISWFWKNRRSGDRYAARLDLWLRPRLGWTPGLCQGTPSGVPFLVDPVHAALSAEAKDQGLKPRPYGCLVRHGLKPFPDTKRFRLRTAAALLLLCIAVACVSCSGGGAAPISTTPSSGSSSSSSGTASNLQVAPVSRTVTVTGSASSNGGNISHSVVLGVTEQ